MSNSSVQSFSPVLLSYQQHIDTRMPTPTITKQNHRLANALFDDILRLYSKGNLLELTHLFESNSDLICSAL